MNDFFVAVFDDFEKRHIEKVFTLMGCPDNYRFFDKQDISAEDYDLLNRCKLFLGSLKEQENLVKELYDAAQILKKDSFLFASTEFYDKDCDKYIIYDQDDSDSLDCALMNLLSQYI